MTEAEIVAWHVAPGQVIREEDPLVDVMTDKATVELPAPVAGTVIAIHGTPGERRPVGSELVVLDVARRGKCQRRLLPPRRLPRGQASARPSPSPQPSPRKRGEGGCRTSRNMQNRRGRRRVAANLPLPASGEREGSALQAREGEGQSSALRAAPHPIARRPGAEAARLAGGAAARLGSRHRTAIRARHRARAAASRTRTSTPMSPRARARPHPAARRGRRRGATVSRRCRSSACAARSPSICRNRSGRSRISPISRRSMSPRSRNCAAQLNADLSRARASDAAAVPDPRAGQRRRGAPAGQRPL